MSALMNTFPGNASQAVGLNATALVAGQPVPPQECEEQGLKGHEEHGQESHSKMVAQSARKTQGEYSQDTDCW